MKRQVHCRQGDAAWDALRVLSTAATAVRHRHRHHHLALLLPPHRQVAHHVDRDARLATFTAAHAAPRQAAPNVALRTFCREFVYTL
jgi:hypothetical protein